MKGTALLSAFLLHFFAPTSANEGFRDTLETAYSKNKTTTEYIGAAVNEGNFQDAQYTSLAAVNYNLVTSENSCKFSPIQPQQGQFDFTGCDKVLAFALENDMAFRGHNLCWGVYNPSWLENGNFSSDDLTEILISHISTVLAHYKGKVVAWDVVNEALNETGTLKHNTWNNITGDETYIDVAFKAARKADPDALLFYNDYNVASSEGWSKTKSDAMFDMVKSMMERSIPIDGVGFQLHVGTGYDMLDGVKANMKRYRDIGIQIHLTELDLQCSQKNGYDCTWSDDMEAQQGELYATLLEACMEEPACTNFETWGFTDKYTWMDDGTFPLPWNEDYTEKKAVGDMRAKLDDL